MRAAARVDLPEPLGPIRACFWPAKISRFAPLTISFSPSVWRMKTRRSRHEKRGWVRSLIARGSLI